ncbi:Pseudouridine synthase I TruA alpha/beta domain [Trinorchestia longiramus]|nr:Pseudouridine synthase I TruA alpha/beta domain [Trinorchestia longiramus]
MWVLIVSYNQLLSIVLLETCHLITLPLQHGRFDIFIVVMALTTQSILQMQEHVQGVHALCNALHVDLLPQVGQRPYDPEFITHHLNVFFRKAEANIRVQGTRAVSQAFDARIHASKRHYLYRLATLPDVRLLPEDAVWGCNFIPLAEVDRLLVVRNPVDVELLREGCALLQREADFASFMHSPSKEEEPPISIKTMEKVELREGQPLMNPLYDPAYDHLKFWDILFTSKSFLRNQIRRCVGTIVALAEGKITRDDIEDMFTNPNPANMPAGATTAHAFGLYLLKIDYPDHVLDPNFVLQDVSEDKKRWLETSSVIKTAVALGQTSIVGDPPSPVEVLARKFTKMSRESRVPNDGDISLKTAESACLDRDTECRESKLNVENESLVYSLSNNKLSNLGDRSVPTNDTMVCSSRGNNVSQMAVDEVEDEKSSVAYTGNCESSLKMSNGRDTDDASREDCDGSADSHNSSMPLSSRAPGSKRRRLMIEACELLEARENIDMRLKIVLEKIGEGCTWMKGHDYSEEGMERRAAEIRQLQQQIKTEKIVRATTMRIRPITASRETYVSG